VAQVHGDYIVNKIVEETFGFFQKVATGYIVIIILKEPRVFIQKVATCCFGIFFVKVISMYLLSTFWSKWWIHLKKTQHTSPGFWLDKLFKKSQLNHNVSTDYIPPCPQCHPLLMAPHKRQCTASPEPAAMGGYRPIPDISLGDEADQVSAINPGFTTVKFAGQKNSAYDIWVFVWVVMTDQNILPEQWPDLLFIGCKLCTQFG